MNLIHNFANQIKKAVATEWLKLLLVRVTGLEPAAS